MVDPAPTLTPEQIRDAQRASAGLAAEAIALVPTGGLTSVAAEEPVYPKGQGKFKINQITIQRGHPITYPQTWFQSNGWIKPIITLPKVKDTTSTEGIMNKILNLLGSSTPVDPDVLKGFLYSIFKGVQEMLSLDWVSMGIIIGKKGEKVGPFDLVRLNLVTGSDQQYTTPAGTDTTAEKSYPALVTLITGTFRICMATNNSYQTILSDQLSKVLSGTAAHDHLDAAKVSFADAYQDDDLVKLFATLDMFYNMFPKSRYAKLRVGTIILSYKDCSALATAAHGATVMQKTTREFSRWLMTDALRRDMFRINVPDQEVSVPYSYMPYFMSLKLSEKSPYSASANPSLHMFVHLVGCAYGVKRSINAICMTPEGIKSVLSNVYLFVYAHERTGDLGAQHYGKSDEETVKKITKFYKDLAAEELKDARPKPDTEKKDDEEAGGSAAPAAKPVDDKTGLGEADYPKDSDFGSDDEDDTRPRFEALEPTSGDALLWLNHLILFKGIVPDFMKVTAKAAWRRIEDPREGTIGEYALNQSKPE